MSASISFQTIPANLRIPLVAVEFDNSQAGFNQTDQVALLIGGTLNAIPMVPVLGLSVASSRSLFGRGSMLARMHEQYLANDSIGTVWLLPVPDPSAGVACAQNIYFTGPATAAGTLCVYIGGQLVAVAVATGDTSPTVAANLATATNALPDLGVTASSVGATTYFVSKHKGLCGNALDIRLNYRGLAAGEVLPANLAAAISDGNTGTLDPDLTGLDAILNDVPYDFIGTGFTSIAALTAIKAVLNNSAGRWSPLRQVYGHAFASVENTEPGLALIGTTFNDPHTSVFGYYDSPTPPWEATAQILGTVAPALKADPARPLQTLQVQGFLAPPSASRFTTAFKQTLLNSGVALLNFDSAGNTTILRAVTTYQTNAYGQADQSYLDSETLFTLMEVQRRLTAMATQKFPRAKVADDGTPFGPGQPIVTPTSFKLEIVGEYGSMETDGLVEDADAMAKATIVTRNSKDPGRLDVLFAPYLIQGLRILAIKNQFRLFSALLAGTDNS